MPRPCGEQEKGHCGWSEVRKGEAQVLKSKVKRNHGTLRLVSGRMDFGFHPAIWKATGEFE